MMAATDNSQTHHRLHPELHTLDDREEEDDQNILTQNTILQIEEEEEEPEQEAASAYKLVDDVRVIPGKRKSKNVALKFKRSELTLTFEGKVYVFQDVPLEKVQAVLSLLGGSEIPSGNGGQCPRCLTVSRRIASLVRFREKRKDRCFDKKLRNNAHKKAAQKVDGKVIKCPLELNETSQMGSELPMETDMGISKDIEVPKLGMVFQSDDEAYEFYNRYARSVGFSIRKSSSTHRSDKTVSRRIFCCSKEGTYREHSRGAPMKPRLQTRTDCKARLVIKIQDDGNYSVAEYVEDHNHELVPPSEVHILRSHRKVRESQVGMFNSMNYAGVGSTGIFSYMNTEVGKTDNFAQMDCNSYLQRRSKDILMKGDAQILLDYFNNMQKENPYFFYSIQLDDNNQICCCFWCDAKSRIDYSYFGDVVCFDTTYRTNDYDRPCALFVGVNNHGQSIPFGCALLWNESTESFVWLFRTFLDAMNGKQPKAIFTDQATPIADAIIQVLPNTHHRFCLSHIYQNAMKHLSDVFEQHKPFMQDFRSCIYSNETEEEFQFSWDVMVKKYNLANNEWLQCLYQMREKWAQFYGREYFCAGITTTKRSEGMNFVKKYFKRSLTLREFVSQYDKAVASRREKEKSQDSISRQAKPDVRTQWPAVVRAAEKYTAKMFALFEKEYLHTLDLFVESLGEDGTVCTYKVSSFENIMPRTVTFDSSDNTVRCSCKKFEIMGILCAHALKILHGRRLTNLPMHYYLNRWTKDARAGVVADDLEKIAYMNCRSSLPLRYADLAYISLTIAVKGSSTDNSTAFAKGLLHRVVGELDNFLKSDSDLTRSLQDIRLMNHDKVGTDPALDHSCGGTMLQDQPHRKTKDKVCGRSKVSVEKAKKRDKAQPRPTGTDELMREVSVGATETTSRPLMASVTPRVPFYSAGPWNIPQYPQGSIEQVDQATLSHTETDNPQCRLMSGGWSAPPSCQGENLPANVIGCPEASNHQGFPFRPVGPSNMPQMPCVYPHVYSEGSTRFIDQATLQHGTSTTQSNLGFVGFLPQRPSSHRLSESSMQQSPRRQDFLEHPAP